MSDLVQLMDAMGISGAHQVVLKASIASWKKNPDAAFQALAASKVLPVLVWFAQKCCARSYMTCLGQRVLRT
jgi:hypothetical protein